ncbi:ARM repeat-containing protein [Gloeophyllum trabeum ATCC 11539]|uniref:Nucleolar protein 9 n=1 Tax=Gloeophyllum trabeum (strain ATCC 11539 / FP-39264 / Madison 617) TaxID=670483 RepID=S7QIS1_GLOTA|nr:ARM repeat-containing protein [Gloeophyllum trabeum ATCC 11539]EPQ59516.1 ARM repeat-containing protein [Gloeophyllum trabeum ATCC 11539]
MPRENRKRGKKHRNSAVDQYEPVPHEQEYEPEAAENEAGPSWIVSAPPVETANPEAPFGYVEADIKAYFRTVDLQLREWQDQRNASQPEDNVDIDPNEERRLFFLAALTEMRGKEKQLATDPDCSNILERMAHSMDDFIRRVFVDSMMGSYVQLVKHRFASHVCQTVFEVASSTVSRETRGILPSVPQSEEQGELRSLTDLILEICEELLPSFTTLIMDPFASHVLRALLLLLFPASLPSDHQKTLRSKKSAAWKSKHVGTMKSVFGENGGTEEVHSVPPSFIAMAVKFVEVLQDELGPNEVRALAADKVASPVLQMLLEIESANAIADKSDSLMDRVLAGLISAYHDNPEATVDPSDYVNALLRDPTSSHMLETVVARVPEPVFGSLWAVYIRPKLARLVNHPVANFVVARAIGRTDEQQLLECYTDLEREGVLGKIVKSARLGVLKAMIDRSQSLPSRVEGVIEAVCKAFDLHSAEDRKLIVPCILHMLPLKEYKRSEPSPINEEQQQGEAKSSKKARSRKFAGDAPKGEERTREPKIQGALLLQSILHLPSPHNELVLDSVRALPIDQLIAISHHPISSRILDAVLDSPGMSVTVKRKFIMSFLGSFHLLVDDRIGSRVGDKCWSIADPFLKEKIARSLIPHEQFLVASYYGKFFARNLRLPLLERKPDAWRALQSGEAQPKQGVPSTVDDPDQRDPKKSKTSPNAQNPTSSVTAKDKGKRKRDAQHGDDIDVLFDESFGKRVKRGALPSSENPKSKVSATAAEDRNLQDVLKAIHSAPSDDRPRHSKKRTK